ncbi:MAG: iron-containing alcohol dehydrogenase [Oscillospiraceae bacterium]
MLCECGKTVTEFSGIMPNPTYSKVLEGAALAKENDIDLIIAVGGGSVMDCCKAVSLAAKYDGDVWVTSGQNRVLSALSLYRSVLL